MSTTTATVWEARDRAGWRSEAAWENYARLVRDPEASGDARLGALCTALHADDTHETARRACDDRVREMNG